MFTGLVAGLGEIIALSRMGEDARLRVRPLFNLDNPIRGESIAVNGACLTIESHASGVFVAYASGETLSRTTLGGLKTGDCVNLERALALGDRLGGHMVSGHVDCLATVSSVSSAGLSTRFRLSFPPEYAPQVIAKGSVALDGISLTINACENDFLEVNIIPETQNATTIKFWTPGRPVNMETDLIGKYVQRCLQWPQARPDSPGLTLDFLREHGF